MVAVKLVILFMKLKGSMATQTTHILLLFTAAILWKRHSEWAQSHWRPALRRSEVKNLFPQINVFASTALFHKIHKVDVLVCESEIRLGTFLSSNRIVGKNTHLYKHYEIAKK